MRMEDAVKLHVALQQVSNGRNPTLPQPRKYVYAVEYNLRQTEAAFKAYQAAANPMDVPEIKAYEEELVARFREICLKNDDGTPKITPRGEFIFDNAEIRDTTLADVKSHHPDYDAAVAAFNESTADLNAKDTPVVIHMIALDDLPEVIDHATLRALFPMIKEPESAA